MLYPLIQLVFQFLNEIDVDEGNESSSCYHQHDDETYISRSVSNERSVQLVCWIKCDRIIVKINCQGLRQMCVVRIREVAWIDKMEYVIMKQDYDEFVGFESDRGKTQFINNPRNRTYLLLSDGHVHLGVKK